MSKHIKIDMHADFRKEDFMKKLLSIFAILTFSFILFACNQTVTPTHTASEIIDALEIVYSSGDSADHVTQNITLPSISELESSANISWESGNPTVLSNTGVVTRQLEDENVVLIVTVALGSSSLQRIFNLTVKGTIVYYTVTFDVEGTQTESRIVSGEKVAQPSDPTLEMYRFTGWATDSISGDMFDFDTAITEDLTLYASFELILYGNYTIEIYIENLEDDQYTLYSTEDFIEEDGTLVEINTNMSAYILNEELSTLSGTVDSEDDIILQAYYDRKIGNYSIEIYKENIEDDLFTLFSTENYDGKVGRTVEMNTEIDGYSLDYEASIVSGIIQSGSDLVLKGYFLVDEGNYSIDIYLESLEDESYEFFSTNGLTDKVGKTVDMESVIPGFIINDELSTISGVISSEADLELVGYFDRIDYNISFYDGGNLLYADTLKYGTAIQAIDDPTKDEYAFLGWSTSPVSETYYSFGDPISSNLILYAQWEVSSIYTYEGYYEGADGLTGTTLELFLRTVVTTGFVGVTYGDARYMLDDTDRDPNNSNNVILVYLGTSVSGAWDGGITWNREHVWPQSLLGASADNNVVNVASDLHNLKPSNPSVNSSRGNKYFDNLTTTVSYAPRDEVKGDIARILFYMTIKYDYLNLVDSNPSVYQMAKLSTLLQWHLEDPVDSFEQHRNDVIFSLQHNRNPFIDHPEFVEKLWGPITLSNGNSIFLNVQTDPYIIMTNDLFNEQEIKRDYIC